MNKNISDEKFDTLLRSVIAEAAMSDDEISEIAGTPAVWHGVHRRIAEQKAATRLAWPPPIAKFWQVLKFGVPAFAAVAILIGIFIIRPAKQTPEQAAFTPDTVQTTTQTLAEPIAQVPAVGASATILGRSSETQRSASIKPAVRAAAAPAKRRAVSNQPSVAETEIRSEFIALSYASDAESGQVVRVKVPSSMMVTLGLVTTVEKPALLVDAEVIVGDDGLTRAIRFIR